MSYSCATGTNRLQSRTQGTSQNYTYDPAGNLTDDGAHVLTYDARGRMVQAATGALTTTYRYNGLGQRVSKTGQGSTAVSRRFVYDDAGHLIGEYDGAGAPIQETVYLGDLPVAVLSGTDGMHYMHADQINTPRAITDTQGTIRWRWDSDPFGVGSPDQDTDGDGLIFPYNSRFAGQYYDVETGLHYNYFRDYDPSLGRYIQSDPIGLEGDINTYVYVSGNPIALTDPEGLDYWVEDADPSESGLGLHQSICVGKHGTRDRFCISFGRKPGQGDCWFQCDGHTYQDRSPPGDIVHPMYRATPRAVDRKIRRYLKSRLNEQRPWDVLGSENCRVFSQQEFWRLVDTYGGATAPPASPSPSPPNR